MVIKILVIFVIGIIYLFIGIGIIFVIDNATLSVLEPTEIVAVILSHNRRCNGCNGLYFLDN